MNAHTEASVNEHTIWKRGLYMLLFAFCLWLAKFVTFAVVVFQFFAVLFTGSSNEKLLRLGQSLSTYQYQVMLFLTFNSETHPYPMEEWPTGTPEIPCDKEND